MKPDGDISIEGTGNRNGTCVHSHKNIEPRIGNLPDSLGIPNGIASAANKNELNLRSMPNSVLKKRFFCPTIQDAQVLSMQAAGSRQSKEPFFCRVDNPLRFRQLLTNYVLNHDHRRLASIVRSGIKVSGDDKFYRGESGFCHAQFSVSIDPTYSDPYWSST
ncbi:tRNA-splicing endonuclease subunit Sen2 [Golovinomyces cichoracearum]|uniref:tRNA-splicing endonuclease subunit Sen2 n=1 Tax=Golovinomyces cichoracearum TaxID=62708 RepID=A0A420IKS2_9PEZI|nr:tRNA-splicing endonuclease subunit Sen2 [Golovinomyces cichoracearum]